MAPENDNSNVLFIEEKSSSDSLGILDQIHPPQSSEMGVLLGADSEMAATWIMAQNGIKKPH